MSVAVKNTSAYNSLMMDVMDAIDMSVVVINTSTYNFLMMSCYGCYRYVCRRNKHEYI